MTDFNLIKGDATIVSHVMGMNIFVPPPLMEHADALGATYADWIALAGAEKFTFFSTESMSKHRKVNKKTLAMLPAWLEAGLPRDYVSIDLASGASYDSDDATRIFIYSGEDDFDPDEEEFDEARSAILRLTLPVQQLSNDAFREQFLTTLSRFPFVSAAAGHALVASPYAKADAQTHAWETSMRHPGFDIYADIIDSFTTGLNGLKTVNWLTAINDDMVAALGGRTQMLMSLPGEVELFPVTGGLVLQAGPEPALGDINLGDTLPFYQAVDALLKPLRDIRVDQAKGFVVDGNDGTAKSRWYARFEPRG